MKVEGIYVSREHVYKGRAGRGPGTEPMVGVDEVECLAGRGLAGDRYAEGAEPGHDKQVTFFAREVWEDVRAKLGVDGKGPSAFRRNVIVSGADLDALIGREFEVQGVRFFGVEEAAPCRWMDHAFAEGAEEALRGNGGLRARILTGGRLRVEPRAGPRARSRAEP